jgi:hypothetical protein
MVLEQVFAEKLLSGQCNSTDFCNLVLANRIGVVASMLLCVAIFTLIPSNIASDESRVKRNIAATCQGATGLRDGCCKRFLTAFELRSKGFVLLKAPRECLRGSLRAAYYAPAVLANADAYAGLHTPGRGPYYCHPLTKNE